MSKKQKGKWKKWFMRTRSVFKGNCGHKHYLSHVLKEDTSSKVRRANGERDLAGSPLHAKQVTNFLMYEKEFIDGAVYNYKVVESSSCAMSFEVWGVRVARESHGKESYEFRDIITFNKEQGVVECTYIMFTEVGILCSHCLRMLHARCVEQVPDQYISKRWCKGIDGQNLDFKKSTGKEHMGCSSVWKMQTLRKMNSTITASQMNKNVRAQCEKYFMELKELIEFDVGSIHCDEDGQGKDLNSLPNVLNPPGSHQKGVRNKTFKSAIENKCDQRKTKKLSKTYVGSSTTPLQIILSTFNLSSSGLHVQHLVGEGSFPSERFHLTYYFHSSNDSSVFMPITALLLSWTTHKILPVGVGPLAVLTEHRLIYNLPNSDLDHSRARAHKSKEIYLRPTRIARRGGTCGLCAADEENFWWFSSSS
ncbi:LOW QUALITY PROTEIN: hypothetical protein Cgig2_019383 [Carnegiea gigantea]|uniref:Protein FAR1-RELATED SEQUENCE n=1 Tax=Carnegiea gigantea TaxID=171969 RepID=A0A9Q1KCH5_9CARY|nr:LOW QUALITY PROTEIN: hypothetical protein Cgig2_019383 [Carnegiea gigantea]